MSAQSTNSLDTVLVEMVVDVVSQHDSTNSLSADWHRKIAIEAIETDRLDDSEWLSARLLTAQNEKEPESDKPVDTTKNDFMKDIVVSQPSQIATPADLAKVLTLHQNWVEEILTLTKDFPSGRANLRDQNLAGYDLRKANLVCADLRGANLRGANLSDANLSRARLEGANLQNADLSRANLKKSKLQHADLRNSILEDAVVDPENLSTAFLRESDLAATYAPIR